MAFSSIITFVILNILRNLFLGTHQIYVVSLYTIRLSAMKNENIFFLHFLTYPGSHFQICHREVKMYFSNIENVTSF